MIRSRIYFDKLSYSIVDFFQTDNRLIMVLGDKMVFRSKSSYLIQKVPLFTKSKNYLDYNSSCKLRPFKKPHLLSNPHLLPCGHAACFRCINQQYNLFKQSITCVLCNLEYELAKQ